MAGTCSSSSLRSACRRWVSDACTASEAMISATRCSICSVRRSCICSPTMRCWVSKRCLHARPVSPSATGSGAGAKVGAGGCAESRPVLHTAGGSGPVLGEGALMQACLGAWQGQRQHLCSPRLGQPASPVPAGRSAPNGLQACWAGA